MSKCGNCPREQGKCLGEWTPGICCKVDPQSEHFDAGWIPYMAGSSPFPILSELPEQPKQEQGITPPAPPVKKPCNCGKRKLTPEQERSRREQLRKRLNG